jgi:hypothetical protein
MEMKRSGSQPSAKGPAEWFTGTVRIDPLFDAPGCCAGSDGPNRLPMLPTSEKRFEVLVLERAAPVPVVVQAHAQHRPTKVHGDIARRAWRMF